MLRLIASLTALWLVKRAQANRRAALARLSSSICTRSTAEHVSVCGRCVKWSVYHP